MVMKKRTVIVLVLAVITQCGGAFADDLGSTAVKDITGLATDPLSRAAGAGDLVWQDYKNFYTPSNLLSVGAGFAGAAALANDRGDRVFVRSFQEHFNSPNSNEFFHASRTFAYPLVQFPIYAGAYLYGEVDKSSVMAASLSEWSQRSVRTYMLGGPHVLLYQNVIGSHRPDEGSSTWNAFNDNDGISYSSFAGAVPFINAAKMNDNFLIKLLLYGGSTLAGLSAIHADKAYLTQAALGWWIAYFSASSVDQTQKVRISVTPTGAEVSIPF